jgi:hypothetical protein
MPEGEEVLYPPGQGFPAVDSKADLLDKINPEKAVEIIKNYFMGKEFNQTTGNWEYNPALQRFSLTEFGANLIAGLIFPASSQNSSLSNLKEERINKRIVGIIKSLVKDMLDYHIEMGIKSEAHMYHIASIVYTHVYVSLTQSEGEGIRRLLNSTIQENRSVMNTEDQKRGGLRGLFRR